MKSFLMKNGVISAVGITAYLAGRFSERWKNSDESLSLFENLPAFPLVGTVSAAVPIPEEKSIEPYAKSGDNVAVRSAQIMKYGFPGLDNVRSFHDFVLSYDQRTRVAHWVFEHLTKDTIKKNKDITRTNCKFTEDRSVHEFFRSTNQDYKGSGFDRGHLAAAGNHRISQQHVDETFFLTNIAPQVGPGFNRDTWNDLEKYVRKLARIHKNVFVCTGPLFLPKKENDGKVYVKYQVLGQNHVAVPTHFFKIVVMENDNNELEMESYVLPNKEIENGTPLHVFQVPPETIERASGLLFFNRISRNKLKRINNKKV
ncbi:endonuclease G, mitochondrial-like [Planococcus citri]|uniref:endonuclease G, mitochondrial-like n=1 Tax=Planococcus citri TaxID=170843 RepID=UPI0031F83B8A